MENKQTEVRRVCQNCGLYERCTKKCGKTGSYTARKASCGSGVWQRDAEEG